MNTYIICLKTQVFHPRGITYEKFMFLTVRN
jgi:hypothetical protein